MRLQKAKIIRTALELLERDGLEGITLRRLAKELGVQAPTIYWHIPNKEALLDEMANAILVERFTTLDFADDRRDWAEWLALFAHELRAAMLTYREGSRVVAGAHLDIATMLAQLLDLSTRVLHNAGFSYSKAATITLLVITFTAGFVIEEQTSPPLLDVSNRPVADPTVGALSAMSASIAEWQAGDETMAKRFATSLRIIINGVRAELQE